MSSAVFEFSTCSLGYSFISSAVSSNNNCDVEFILSDIPFISVGMLACGASALFFVIRPFTLAVVSLYFSVLLSFAAVVIDLTRILIYALTQVTVQPLIIAREVLLALSLGLRFLCYWLYVSEPPIGDPRPPACQDRWNNFLTLGSQHNIHSGSWSRWGVSGLYAKVALLATIPAITALQIIWRLIQRYHVYGAVYAVNVTLEIVVSLLLLIKLLVNTISTSSITRSHTFGEYVFPILALMFNIGISVGNLILFAFTESILGRLLQAGELYILIVFMMILQFFHHKKTPAISKTRDLALLKVELPHRARESTFRLSPPVVSTPRVITRSSSGNQSRSINADVTRHSVLTTVRAPWVPWRMSHGQSDQDEEKAKLWDQSEAGKGAPDLPAVGQGSAGNQSMTSAAPVTDRVSTEWRDIVNDSVSNFSRLSLLDAQFASAGSRNSSISSGQIWHAVRADIPTRPHPLKLRTVSLAVPTTATSSDENGAAVIMTAPPDPPAQNSPIFAIKGFTPQPPQVPSRQSSSSRSLEELVELQNELDKTIAMLRLFSPSSPISYSSTSTSPTSTSPSSPSSSRRDSNQAEEPRQSSSTGARTVSDFSLSNFPSPPWLAPSLPASSPAVKLRSKEDRQARLRLGQDSISDTLGLPLPRIPAALEDIPRSPRSDLASDSSYQEDNEVLPADAGRPHRFDSGGTHHRNAMVYKPSDVSGESAPNLDVAESYGSREAFPHLPISPFHPSPLGEARLMRLPSSSARHRRSQLSMQMELSPITNSEEEASDPDLESAVPLVQRGMRPPILPSTTMTSPHAQLSNVSAGMRSSRGLTGLPRRPRLAPDLSASRPLSEDMHIPGAFERSQSTPLIFRSDDEYYSTGTRSW
ncbi:uncharacterized protein F5891DRAFT_1198572 [Suillus fuscotomentosus]|uniref:Uncharacterized protein n=1 Tax=Suillus fuscotomentosus TaxID=1912939 RepID=A0AAD4HCW2_9AGAM|nr:uncharacterized protein F5891DRAFT_1198572 [Suillus fuscotomentosus]KAG1889643.1 hypothetical protein F5891DRAFT_1198572 [Suillus fuscotomentosus]